MKPLRLRMAAFGPYAGEQVIDFRDLGGRSFFLIHGATGAGKTTILDAICFALYGVSSGLERPGKSLRSDFAEPADLTEVTFEFSLGAASYRIHRSPEQERPRKRGPGTAMAEKQATLWKLSAEEAAVRTEGAGQGPGEGAVLAARWEKVTEAVEKLLGLHSQQFRQVILIPQGQFRQLLLSSSEDRQKILEVLFKTECFRRIEAALQDSFRAAGDSIRELETRRRFILDQAGAGEPEELAVRRAEGQAFLEEARGRLVRLAEREAAVRTAILAARQSLEIIRRREEAIRALAELELQAPLREAGRADLERARRAGLLADAERQLAEREKTGQEAGSRAAEALSSLETAREAKEKSERRRIEEENRAPEREEAGEHLRRLAELASKAGDLEAMAAAVETARAKVQALLRDRGEAEGRLAGEEKIEKRKAAEAQEAEVLASRTEALRRSMQEAAHRRKLRSRLFKARQDRAAIEGKLAASRASGADPEAAFRESRRALDLAQEARLRGQAGILAGSLVDGSPCPVCGSTDHPAPAPPAADLPSEAALQGLKAAADQREAARDRWKAQGAELDAALGRAAAEVAALEAGLGDAADAGDGGAAAPDSLQAREQQLETEAAAAEKALAALPALRAELERRREAIAGGKAAVELAGASLKSAQENETRLAAVLEDRRQELPAEFREPAALKAAEVRAREASRLLEEASRDAANRSREAADLWARAETVRQEAARQSAEAARTFQEAHTEFSSRLQAAGFAGAEDYRRARIEPRELQRREVDLQQFHQDLHAARDRHRRAVEAAAGAAAPDLPPLEREEMVLKGEIADLHRREATAAERNLRIDKWMMELGDIGTRLAALEARYGLVGGIAEVACGKNEQGITFQRFVLAAMLDDVLIAASERLRRMSRGRFILQRAAERADRRKAGGLDLEVFDSHTGTARGVATLSGGESFLASLSLALGLADMVQSYSGGAHLDTLFIDEGFGTLDPESLDLAMRALLDLQRNGRLIGIISHVPELRERIDARLEVTAGRRGSAARFVVG